MKKEYKFLIELCNNLKAPSCKNDWWHTRTGGEYVTSKSDFVEHIIKILTKKDKNFPKEEFLKQVKCKYEGFQLIDIVYTKKLARKHRKELIEKSDKETVLYDDYNLKW